ncbi:MAG: hypothetical protein FJ207_13985 [Gemmatimonadetes bacterium]|nr:hypothetical protein [Gemmatimonadota bacterium]
MADPERGWDRYLSRSGFLQVSLSGQLDLETIHVGRDRWAGLVGGEGADSIPADWVNACAGCHQTENVEQRGKGGEFIFPRLRVFTDIFVGDQVYALIELRGDRGHAPSDGSLRGRVEQAYLRVSNAGASFGIQAGRFASPFGSYGLRHLTGADPFLRPPLGYDYRTVMNRSHAPGGASGFLTWQDWPEFFRLTGVPPVWDVPYQWGAMAFGAVGPVAVKAAAMNSAPSSAPDAWGISSDRFEHPSWVAAGRCRASPSLEVGVSYNRGPWLEEITAGSIQPVGGDTRSRWDFDQEMWSADFSFARGESVLRGEVILDSWAVPNIADPFKEIAYHVEAQRDLIAGVSAAARVGYLDFRRVEGGSGPNEDWDYDVVRVEGSVGYRIVRNGGLLLSGYWQDAGEGGTTTLGGLRLWWAF